MGHVTGQILNCLSEITGIAALPATALASSATGRKFSIFPNQIYRHIHGRYSRPGALTLRSRIIPASAG